ncbi:MAG: hypothetical protein ACREV2_07140 [Burkholderiales bacterium]
MAGRTRVRAPWELTMLKSRIAIIGFSAVALYGASLANAQDDVMFATGGYARAGQGMRTEKMMKAMDKNSDKQISKEEFMKVHEGMFDKMDKDKDGMLSAAEFIGKLAPER